MSKTAVFIRHRAVPGQRDEVRRIWEEHLRPRAEANPAHEAYFYCYDDDPDVICVFQQYSDREASRSFLEGPWYAAYVREVAAVTAQAPEVRVGTTVWAKGG